MTSVIRLIAGVSAAAVLLAAIPGYGGPSAPSRSGEVDDARLAAGSPDGADWLSYGRTMDEQRYSPLTQIRDDNVRGLGLAWFADLDTARGQEATPIVVDGIIYTSTAWSMVKAYDAVSGTLLWSFDPKIPRSKLINMCCDAVNRGVAFYKGKVFVGTLDGRLIALDAANGKVVWDRLTVPPGSQMSITGAPRIAKGKVLIGSSGSEYLSRGYLAAFDAETGKQAWRFYTVPGDPSKPFEGRHLKAAAATWAPGAWKNGGGGTVWDSITYDPETDLVYFGTANAEPWNPRARGGRAGDSLYTASVVAVRPDTGEYVWHFQETPEDRWDFDSTQQIMLVNLQIGGHTRRAILHAPKNGFFYVLDAKTGRFLSGAAFVPDVTWAQGLDPQGKPIIAPAARYEVTGKPFLGYPGTLGAHSWNAMSFSPQTGLVYIPVNRAGQLFTAAASDWNPQGKLGLQLGLDLTDAGLPADPILRREIAKSVVGELVAWDPVAQRARWRIPHAGPSNGGTLATAGNLVFQGTAAGTLLAYAADSGKELWSYPVQSGVVAAPITFTARGEQYVALMVGWGGSYALSAGFLAQRAGLTRNISRLLVFKIGGKVTLPAPPADADLVLDPPPFSGTAAQANLGRRIYMNSCIYCHGDAAISGGLVPDLRHSSTLNTRGLWQQVVYDGLLKDNGMVGWKRQYSREDVEAVRQYVVQRANADKQNQ